LACDGWWSVTNPWMHYVTSQYVDWCHIHKFWPVQRHDIHVKNNVAHFNSYKNHRMKKLLVDVNLVIWGS